MVSPKTWRGYDKDGNVLCSVTAVDANEYINPAEVQAAIEKVESTAESGIDSIVAALNNVEPDASDAIIVQGTRMTETIEQACDAIKQVPGKIVETIAELYNISVREHDRLQNEANDAAYNSAWINNVVNVR